jgi:hypothetical protein
MLSILLALVILGFLLWLVNTYVPMDARFKQVFNVLAILVAVVWVIRSLGLFTMF